MKVSSLKKKGETVDLTGNDEILGMIKQKKSSFANRELMDMPQLALACAKYFKSMSLFCLTFYQNAINNNQEELQNALNKLERSKINRKLRKQRKAEQLAKIGPPKKPLTAYIIYFQERVPVFCQKHKNAQISELTKLIAKEWKQLLPEDKKAFLIRAAQDRDRYEAQCLAFKAKRMASASKPKPAAESKIVVEGQHVEQFQNIDENQDQHSELDQDSEDLSDLSNSQINEEEDDDEKNSGEEVDEENSSEMEIEEDMSQKCESNNPSIQSDHEHRL